MVSERFKDEKAIQDYTAAGIISYLWIPFIVAAVVVPFHEAMHALGALIEGGTITSFTYLNIDAWINQFFLFGQPGGPLGSVSAEMLSGFLFFPPGTVFFFLPYAASFAAGLFLLGGDNVGLPNLSRTIGAAMIFYNLIALPFDYAAFQGVEAVFPYPRLLVEGVYIGVVLVGISVTTWKALLDKL